MPAFLSRVIGRFRALNPAQRGLVFVSLRDDARFHDAAPGEIIRNKDPGPPWIVVAHSAESVGVVRWPGRLWEVEVVRKASDQPRAGADYTRAVAVRMCREVPAATLFGPHGDDVVRVIEAAASIDINQAQDLGTRSGARAREAYSRAWNAWIAKAGPTSIHRGSDHAHTLAVFAGGTRSPIHSGFTVIHSVLAERASCLVGNAAFRPGEDDDVYLADPWVAALDALLDAAMALGAPELVPAADRDVLIDAWEHGFGRSS